MGPLSCPPEIIIPSRLSFLDFISVQWLHASACAAPAFNRIIAPQLIYAVGVKQSWPWPSDSWRQGPCESSAPSSSQPLPAMWFESMSGKGPLSPRAPSQALFCGNSSAWVDCPGASGETGTSHRAGPHIWEFAESALPQLRLSWPRQVEQVLTSPSLSPSSGP